jgi:hypothetical protein
MGLPIAIIFVFSVLLLKLFFRRELTADQIIEKESSG